MKLQVIHALLVIASLTGTTASQAIEPELDATFGIGGRAHSSTQPGYADAPNAFMIQPDGRLLAAGVADGPAGWFIAMARHLSDGSPDPSFGAGGVISTRWQFRDQANAVALQSDGKIVVAGMQMVSNGTSDQVPSIYRFNADGSIDSLFALDGARVGRWDPVSSGEMSAVAVLPDGKILAAGRCNANINGGVNGLGFRRLLSDGSPDPSYGMNGTLRFEMPLLSILFTRPAVDFTPDFGAMIATTVFRNGRVEFIVMQVDGDGDVVPIGGANLLFPEVPIDNHHLKLVRRDDGSFYVGCTVPRPSQPSLKNFGVFRFLADGQLDPNFGEGGAVSIPVSISPDVCYALAIAPDGKILLGGGAGTGEAALVRLNADGSPDAAFGANGVASPDLTFTFGSAWVTDIAFDAQQRMLASGFDFTSNQGDFVLARFGASPTPVDGKVPSLPNVTLTSYPNPAGASVVFGFDLPEAAHAHVDIFDASGRRVATLTESTKRAGSREMHWDGRTTGGSAAPSGVYFARLAARGVSGAIHRGSTKVIRLK